MSTINQACGDRRTVLSLLSGTVALPLLAGCGIVQAQAKEFPVKRSDAEWQKRLTKAQYDVLRRAATERAYTSPLNDEKRTGIYRCAGCDNALFPSKTKYDSGTGWPSFWKPLPRAVGISTDYKLGYPRKEVHCADCGGHLGHVFGDGPRPTGKRYCMNGVAMTFDPA